MRIFIFCLWLGATLSCQGTKDKQDNEVVNEAEVKKGKKMVLSLGEACTSRWHIQYTYYKASVETNFFDWAFSTNFADVVKTLNLTDPKTVFSPQNVVVGGGDAHVGGRFKDVSSIFFPHDMEKDANLEKEVASFADRYLRRYKRFLKNITDSETLYFLRWGKPLTEAEIAQFFQTLERLKPGNTHVLVNAYREDSSVDVSKYPWHERFKAFDLRQFPLLRPVENHYSNNHYDWPKVFA